MWPYGKFEDKSTFELISAMIIAIPIAVFFIWLFTNWVTNQINTTEVLLGAFPILLIMLFYDWRYKLLFWS